MEAKTISPRDTCLPTHSFDSNHVAAQQNLSTSINKEHSIKAHAFTWDQKADATQPSIVPQPPSSKPSAFDNFANALRPAMQSIANTSLPEKSIKTDTPHIRTQRSVVPVDTMLEDVSNSYPGGVHSQQYQFVLSTINRSPMLLEMMYNYSAPLRITEHSNTMVNSPYAASISKQELDQAHQLYQRPEYAEQGAVKLLAKLAHEYGRREFVLGNTPVTKVFDDRRKAWINSLPSTTQGLNGFNVQQFADDFAVTNLAPEAYAAIRAWNTVIGSTGVLDPLQYATVLNSGMVRNSDATITPTVDNVYKRAQDLAKNDHYKNRYFFDGGGMALIARHAKPGDVIKLSGYDANRIMAYGFIQKADAVDTFIKNAPF